MYQVLSLVQTMKYGKEPQRQEQEERWYRDPVLELFPPHSVFFWGPDSEVWVPGQVFEARHPPNSPELF